MSMDGLRQNSINLKSMSFPDELGKFPPRYPVRPFASSCTWNRAGEAPSARAASLRRRSRRARVCRNEIIDRGLRAAFVVRDAGERQRHFGDRQRPHEHALVHVAEMADAE